MNVINQSIDKEERKRLVKSAFEKNNSLRLIQFCCVFVPLLFVRQISNDLFPTPNDAVWHFLCTVVLAALSYLLLWGLFGRPRLNAEIMKLKQASKTG